MIQKIPDGSTLEQMNNGDVLITFPGVTIPTLRVQKDLYYAEPLFESLLKHHSLKRHDNTLHCISQRSALIESSMAASFSMQK